ncbi:FMN-binding protein [Isachenkonia alkalipeptolytica]|uniref:FMN-binding protein n=1 Tax=Isachenkonia alkalipeptolytica TaxID=2565777 RepID=A0AA43XME3_9CLOT|nr:FMN-binding protein [Isachenkonia alkalipeptolytica]NBG88929.1 FMN-binding protein [Isachenkonia alkalipeptolytica]
MSGGSQRKQGITGFVILAVLAIIVLSANQFTQGLGNEDIVYEDQIFGSGQGYKGEIVLELILEGENFKGIKAIEFHDTSQVFNEVLTTIEKDLLKGIPLEEIEVITGATATYYGIIEALEEGFAQLNK